MYESVSAYFDDMGVYLECWARDLHDFFNVAWQTVDLRKARKIVMCKTRPIKRISKTFAYLIMKILD